MRFIAQRHMRPYALVALYVAIELNARSQGFITYRDQPKEKIALGMRARPKGFQ